MSAADPNSRAEAGKEFRRGEAAFKSGAYADAADAFERAYAIAPNPAALFNAAEARAKAGQLARAARLYVRVLADKGTAPRDRRDATQRMTELSAKLARIAVVATGGESVTIDGEAAAPDDTYADPGDHVVGAVFPSGPVTRKINAPAGVRTPGGDRAGHRGGAGPTAPVSLLRPWSSSPRRSRSRPRGSSVGAGVSVALGGATVASGLDANAARAAYDKAPSKAGLEAGYGKVTRTNVLLVSAIVAGVTTGALGIFAVRWKSRNATTAARLLRLEGSFEWSRPKRLPGPPTSRRGSSVATSS